MNEKFQKILDDINKSTKEVKVLPVDIGLEFEFLKQMGAEGK